jgi:hypothetical protein
MDESEYKSVYQQATPVRCVFEKGILLRQLACSRSIRINIAEREGVNCEAQQYQQCCKEWLSLLKQKSMFCLQLTDIDTPLPHAKEIKLQAGGIHGLNEVLDQKITSDRPADIFKVLQLAIQQFGTLEMVPFPDVIKAVSGFQARKRAHK